MFGIGLPEMLVIGLVALVVLGPDRLPEAARNLGKAIADIRRATEPARSAWTDMTTELNSVITATGNPWTVHPVLEKMTPDEREAYMNGGEMPGHVADELERIERERPTVLTASSGADTLDYPMPHAEPRPDSHTVYASEPAAISYPAPTGTNHVEKQQETQ